MKQFITLCIAAAATLLAVSCNMEDVYTISNYDDIVTVKGEYLVNDFGTTYHVTQDQTGSKDWQKDDERLYALFDVLNRQLDISLKEVHRMEIVEPDQLTVQEEEPKDPVVVVLQNVVGYRVNLALQIFKEKGTECPHEISFQYRNTPNSSDVELFIIHEGNDENPSRIAEDDLKTELRFFTVNLDKIVSSATGKVTLNFDQLTKDNEGKYTVSRASYQLSRSGGNYYTAN